MYLFLFEDGEIRQTDVEPTDGDLGCVQDGILDIIKFMPGGFLRHDGEKWVEVQQAKEAEEDGAIWHTT